MEVDLQSLFGLHVTWCAQLYSLAETPQLLPTPAFGLVLRGCYWTDKRHLFGTPCFNQTKTNMPYHGSVLCTCVSAEPLMQGLLTSVQYKWQRSSVGSASALACSYFKNVLLSPRHGARHPMQEAFLQAKRQRRRNPELEFLNSLRRLETEEE